MPHPPIDDSALPTHWLTALAREPVRAGLEAVYAHAAAEIAERGPSCWASGRCCNFAKTGHRLYVTGLEAAYCVRGLESNPPLRAGVAPPALTPASLADALARGGCPFQVANLCGVHAIKPLGCRLYFCDRSAQHWQNDLSERLLANIRALHEDHEIVYRYAEWRATLALFLPSAAAPAVVG